MPDLNQPEQQYRAITANAWVGMLVIPIAARVTELWQFALQGSDQAARPIGPPFGIWLFTIATCASALLAVAIRTVDSRPFRRFVVFASELYLTTLILIQILDVVTGLPWSEFHIIFVATHDTLALWACWASWRWFHLARPDAPSTHRWTSATTPATPNEGPQADV